MRDRFFTQHLSQNGVSSVELANALTMLGNKVAQANVAALVI